MSETRSTLFHVILRITCTLHTLHNTTHYTTHDGKREVVSGE